MNPIYMPFTHISEKSADGIHHLLGPVILYQPGGLPIPFKVGQLSEREAIKIRIPSEPKDDDPIAAIKQNYHAWANGLSNRSRIDVRAFMASCDPIPFYQESSSAHIRTEITQLCRGEALGLRNDPILTARLFLALAQEYDVQKLELAQDMSAVAHMEKHLLENLKGYQGEGFNFSQIQEDFIEDLGSYMTRSRIDAWSVLYQNTDSGADVFVTDSLAVMEQLCETSQDLLLVPELARLIQLKKNSNNHHECPHMIREMLTQLGQSDAPLTLIEKWTQAINESNQKPLKFLDQWSVYLATGVSPDLFWARFGNNSDDKKRAVEIKSEMLNTLIFHLKL
jgi:hypothetical protein